MRYPGIMLISLLAAALFMTMACGDNSEPKNQAFKLDVRGGELDASSDSIRVNQGDSVTLAISSDEHGMVHLHGYDIEVSVGPDEHGEIKLDASATGNFPITFHSGESEEESTHDKGHGHKNGEGSSHEGGEEKRLGALEVLPR